MCFHFSVTNNFVRPLPLELTRGNVKKEEHKRRDNERDFGIDYVVDILEDVFKNLPRLFNHVTAAEFRDLSDERICVILIPEEVVLLGVSKGLVGGRACKQSAVLALFLDKNFVESGRSYRKGKA